MLTEVIDLFPGEYIHIGGDECPKYRWEHCSKCQNRIKSEGLNDEHELQSYFIKRIANFLESKGKKLIGWDEILEGGLASNATVQSWRGMDGAFQAAMQGNNAIASPTSHCYLDYSLDAIDVEKIYNFQPIPAELPRDKHSFILGGECNMWTEWVPNDSVLHDRIYPRMIALAERLWTNPVQTEYTSFYGRLQNHYKFLDVFGIKYGAETIPVRLSSYADTNAIHIELKKGGENLVLHYTIDGKESTVYKKNIELKTTADFAVQAYKNDKKYGAALQRTFVKHAATGRVPQLSYTYSEHYTGGGPAAVTNGALGSLDFRDGNWQAVQKVPMEITVDLSKVTSIDTLAANFYQKQDSWIFLPIKVDFLTSEDGNKFELIQSIINTVSPKKDGSFIHRFATPVNKEARFVRMKAHNITYCPEWHAAPGSEAWLFVDEFIVK